MSHTKVQRNKASILIIALWSLCLLSVFAVILAYEVRQKINLVKRLDERSKLRLIADAGIKASLSKLKKEEVKTYDSLQDAWSNDISAFKDINLDAGRYNICYNTKNSESAVIETRWGIIDEERKININTASKSVLERLFHILLDFDETQAQELAASIVDWRDNDSELSIPIGSGEDPYYSGLRYPYEAKDTKFEILEEALLVKGMSMDIFAQIKDYLTVYGNGKVNINTASRQVLLALGLNASIVEKIFYFRNGRNESDSAEGNIFIELSSIVPQLSQYVNLSDSEIAQLSVVSEQLLSTKSNNFMIRCVAGLNNRKDITELSCVVKRDGKILYSREN